MVEKRGSKRYLIYVVFFVLLFLSILILIPFLSGGDSQSSTIYEWLMRGRNLNNTRYYPNSINMSSFGFLWNVTIVGSTYYSSPSIANGIVYFGSFDKRVYALNISNNGSQIWNYTTLGGISPSPAIVNGILYIGSNDNRTYALNATDGTYIWNYTGEKEFYTAPAVANGIVYMGNSDNKTYALNATDGTHIWNYSTKSYVISSPAVVGEILYIGGWDNRTYALNATNGTHIWNYTTGDYISGSPAVAYGIVYIGSADNKTYALNATDGTHIWNYSMRFDSQVLDSPAVAHGMVYIGAASDKNVYALNATNGSKIWNFTTINSLSYSSPTVAGDIVFVGGASGWIYALNATNGSLIWNYDVSNSTSATIGSPTIANGTVYVTNNWPGGVTAFGYVPETCVESWTCTDWGTCQTDPIKQYRTCTDSNSCGSTVSKPALSQDCTYDGGGTTTTTTTTSVPSIPAGEPTDITITNPNIEVGGVTITSTESVSSVSVTVTEVPKTAIADFVAGLSLGKVYQALNISVTGLNNSQIANATVNFRVNMSWIEGQKKNVTSEDILLFRRNESGVWGALATTYLHNDSHYYYYSAITPGFSTFVIFYGRYDCEPGINRCFESQIQMCLGNATWLTTEKCAYGCGNEGVCFESVLQSKTFYTVIIALVSAGIVITIYYLLARVFKKRKR